MSNTIVSTDILADLAPLVENIPAGQLFVLADTGTAQHCLPRLLQIPRMATAQQIIIPAGDENKNLRTLTHVWEFLSEHGATRQALLVNVGGGVVTDLGGFAASTFKRGFAYINVATTLLAAVDAATGGKTGINFQGLKNEIGLFAPAQKVLVATEFFDTLDSRNLRSGYAEMLKHALICSDEDVQELLRFDLCLPDKDELTRLLRRNMAIKEHIVAADPHETGLRKALNFGHTVGHAIESLSYQTPHPAPHGYAVMWGMVAELYLSHIRLSFPTDKLRPVIALMRQLYGAADCPCHQYDQLLELMHHDKKNDSAAINFTLLANVGDVRINQTATDAEIREALDFISNN